MVALEHPKKVDKKGNWTIQTDNYIIKANKHKTKKCKGCLCKPVRLDCNVGSSDYNKNNT